MTRPRWMCLLWVVMGLAGCSDSTSDSGAPPPPPPPDSSIDGTGTTVVTLPTTTATDGCIQIDGRGDYATVNDAIANATTGDTITLCALGEHEEAVLIDRSITLIGPGVDSLLLTAPVNTNAITITAANVIVSGLSVDSTRSGISVEEASGVQLSDIRVAGADNWGIKSSDSEELQLTGISLVENGYGGLQISGGSASLSDSEVVGNQSYGIHGTDCALTLSHNVIADTQAIDPKEPLDGYGLMVEEWGSATLEGNTFSGHALTNIASDQASLSMLGDTLAQAPVGMWVDYGTVDLQDVVVSDGHRFGIYIYTPYPVSLSGLTISGDRKQTMETSNEAWGGEELGFSGTGLVVVANEIALLDSTISGYNGAGVLLIEEDQGQALIERVTISDIARHGLILDGIDTTASEVTIAGVEQPEEPKKGSSVCGYVDQTVAVYSDDNALDWSNGQISNSAGYGITGSQAILQISSSDFSGNFCAGIMDYFGVLTASANTFSQPGTESNLSASVVSYYSLGLVLENSSFSDSQTPAEEIQESSNSDGSTNTYAFQLTAGLDLYATGTEDILVKDNTFTSGTNGFYLYDSSGIIEGNTWTDYTDTPITVYYTDSLELSENQLSGFGYYGLSCVESGIELEDSALSSGTIFSYDYDYYLDDAYINTYSTTQVGYALYGYNCSMSVDDVTLTDLGGSAIRGRSYGSSDSYELSRIDITRAGQDEAAYYPPVYFYVSSDEGGANEVLIDQLSLTEAGLLQGMLFSSATNPLDVDMNEVTVSGAADVGIYLSGAAVSLTASGLSLSEMGYSGLYSSSAPVTLTNAIITDNGSAGLWLSAADATISSSTVSDNGYIGLYSSTAQLDVSDTTIGNNGDAGLWLEYTTATISETELSENASYGALMVYSDASINDVDGTSNASNGLWLYASTASVTDNTFSLNDAYGMVCTSSEVDVCYGNDLSDNASGEHQGCPDTCGMPADPE